MSVGVEFETDEERKRKFGGSTDMGNVSQVIPSLHPKFHVGAYVSNHSKEMTVVSGSDAAQPYTLAVAKALALTALDVLRDKQLLQQIKKDFEDDMSKLSHNDWAVEPTCSCMKLFEFLCITPSNTLVLYVFFAFVYYRLEKAKMILLLSYVPSNVYIVYAVLSGSLLNFFYLFKSALNRWLTNTLFNIFLFS